MNVKYFELNSSTTPFLLPPLYPLYDFFELAKSLKLVISDALFSHYYFTSIEGQSCIKVKSRNPLISIYIHRTSLLLHYSVLLFNSLFNELVKYSAMICQKLKTRKKIYKSICIEQIVLFSIFMSLI